MDGKEPNPSNASDPWSGLQRLEEVLAEVATGFGSIHSALSHADASQAERSVAAETRAAPNNPRQRKLRILEHLLGTNTECLTPQLHPGAALGHAFSAVDEILRVRPGEGVAALEELADLGLLQRRLHNRVHTCPKCRHCQINFRETCDTCDSIDLSIERLIHHFACAHIGLETEFVDGMDLRCPKCRQRLFQLGQDFDRPHETYLCHECSRVTEAPVVTGQCLNCAQMFALRDAEVVDIHSYTPTELAPRAIELGRLTGLQVAELLFDPEVRLARLEYLLLEARREFHRLKRHSGSVAIVVLRFELEGRPFPLFREAPARAIQDFGRRLSTSLRELDLAAPAHASALSLLLPETDLQGAQRAAERLDSILSRVVCQARLGQHAEYRAEIYAWDEVPDDVEMVVQLLRAEDEP